ncbi:MAG: nitroreductase, partial [Dehalococcoidia bacterium]
MPIPAHKPLDVMDALHSTPSRRYLKPDPIPDDVLRAILDAALRGPTPGNAQNWGWVVVTDPAVKQPIAEWYREGWQRAYGSRREAILASAGQPGGLGPRN